MIKSFLNFSLSDSSFYKIGFLVILAYFVVLFCGTLIKIQNDTKEANCITYYTSLGYTANGCEKYIERYITGNE